MTAGWIMVKVHESEYATSKRIRIASDIEALAMVPVPYMWCIKRG